jgi:hypothetical protein
MSQTQLIIPEIDEIVNFYTPELVEKIAKQTGFVQRKSKLGGTEFLGVMTQGLFAKPNATLNQMSAMAKEIDPDLKISKQGFHQRLDKSGAAFLREMLSKALELSTAKLIDEEIPKLLGKFRKVHLLDSTYIPLSDNLSDVWRGSGGTGSKSGMKLQLMIEYKSGKYESIVTTTGVTPDQKYMEQAIKLIDSNELMIYDLGYSKQIYMIDISEKGGYFISRFNPQIILYRIADRMVEGKDSLNKFNLEGELRRLDSRGIKFQEIELWMLKPGKSLKVRLIVKKVSESVLKERLKKAQRKAGKKKRKPTSKYLYLQSWDLYITNVEGDKIEAKEVILLYEIRWQVEIVFKSWKSYHGLEYVKGQKAERVECFMYGRLIMIVIMCFLFNSIHRNVWNTKKREVSLLKVIGHFQVKAYRILTFLSIPRALARYLVDEFSEACRHCLTDIRKRLTTAQKVRERQVFTLA